MAYQAADIADLIATTQAELGKGSWTELSQSLQEFTAMDRLLKKDRMTFGSGTSIKFNIRHAIGSHAKVVGLFDQDQVNIGGVLVTGEVPWRHMTTNYAFEDREIQMNASPAQIVSLVKVRRTEMFLDWAGFWERLFWGKPATSADTLTPFGLEYWDVPNASVGFNGGDPSGFSGGAAGLATATYARWKNYTGTYSAVSKTDLILTLRKALRSTQFKAPVSIPQYAAEKSRYGLYTNLDTVMAMEALVEAQNDNLGNDMASKDGTVTFRRIPVEDVPALDVAGYNSLYASVPIYGIDWEAFNPTFLEGEYMNESAPKPDPLRHRTTVVHVDCSMNFVCRDRRRLIVLYKA
jgi:hypothetical protein